MKLLKNALFFFGTFSILSFINISTDTIDGINVIFRGTYEEEYYTVPNSMGSSPFNNFNVGYGSNYNLPNENMKFVVLYLTIENNGASVCNFDLKDVYLSTMKDSLYPFYGSDRFNTKETIKPKKKIKRKVYFEFPKNEQPKELFIEDKRFKVEEGK